MKITRWGTFMLFGLMLCVLYPDAGFASRVFTVDEIKGKIVEGKVKEMYVSDIGIEGIYDDRGIDAPFMVFSKSEEITDDLTKLAKKHGVKYGFKDVYESPTPTPAGIPTALIFQIVIAAIYWGILAVIIVGLLSINKKLKRVLLLLTEDKNKSKEGSGT